MANFDEQLAIANQKLKLANTKVSIERRGGKLQLRATLPPKPHIQKFGSYQQQVSLGLNANPAGLQSAVIKAKKMGLQISAGTFDWEEWLGESSRLISVWLEKFEESHWARKKKTDAAVTTWKKDYQVVFNKLDGNRVLCLDYLIEVVRTTEPDSRSRLKVCTYLHKLGEFACISDIEKIKSLRGKYSPSQVQPRNLPTDSQIAQYRGEVNNEAWRWVYGVMACYGLRNHEVFKLDMRDFPTIRVLEKTKTGERFIYPLYPEWAERWELNIIKIPNLDLTLSNAKLGTKISGWFYKNKLPFNAYDLRHSYARRCFEFGLAPDFAAKLMGHSLSVHTSTYRAWIEEDIYKKAYTTVMNKENRPLAPK